MNENSTNTTEAIAEPEATTEVDVVQSDPPPVYGGSEVTAPASDDGSNDAAPQANTETQNSQTGGATLAPAKGQFVIVRNTTIPASNDSQDHPAIITRVNDDSTINATVFPDCGYPYPVKGVPQIDPAGDVAEGWYWRWQQ